MPLAEPQGIDDLLAGAAGRVGDGEDVTGPATRRHRGVEDTVRVQEALRVSVAEE